jgi:glycosyltransferase involved in cell wall biosynthesis
VAASTDRRDHGSAPLTLFVDVTNSTRDPANAGVIRVSRRLSSELGHHASPIFVVWHSALTTYVLPSRSEYEQLGQFHGPSIERKNLVSSDETPTLLNEVPALLDPGERWLILPEIRSERDAVQIRRFAKTHGLRIGAIFYDAIPVLHPELCNSEITSNHAAYMRGLAACDIVQPISAFSAECLADFWNREGIAGGRIVTNELPGEFGGSRRPDSAAAGPANCVRILCVSTLEPRKNHRTLLRSCLRLQERWPDLNWSLTRREQVRGVSRHRRADRGDRTSQPTHQMARCRG